MRTSRGMWCLRHAGRRSSSVARVAPRGGPAVCACTRVLVPPNLHIHNTYMSNIAAHQIAQAHPCDSRRLASVSLFVPRVSRAVLHTRLCSNYNPLQSLYTHRLLSCTCPRLSAPLRAAPSRAIMCKVCAVPELWHGVAGRRACTPRTVAEY